MAENQLKTTESTLVAEMFVFEEASHTTQCDAKDTGQMQLPSEFYQYFQIEEAA